MLLLVVGTIVEQQHGLYYAQQTYFSVYFFLLFGVIPLPGTYTILSAIFISLLCKLLLDKWQTSNLGSLVTHISGLLLLIGGFLTAHFSHEGYMAIAENASSNYISDYHDLELVVTSKQSDKPQNGTNIIFDNNQIKLNNILNDKLLPFNIKIVNYCKHCELKNNHLTKLPKPKDNEQPETIIGISILNNSMKLNQEIIYLKHDDKQPYPITLSSPDNNKFFYLQLRNKMTLLPFSITLNKFQQSLHPGTNIAKEYQSEVTLTTNSNQSNNNWHGVISMNQPLRYKGYTFYQASFYKQDNQNTTVLAAVYNVGQSFPYIASIVLCIGLLIHLMQKIPRLIKPSTQSAIPSLLIVFTTLVLALPNNNSCYANSIDSKLDYATLSTLPVLHDGRIKPLDSFARIILKSIANKETINNKSASQWLLDLLFNPKEDYNNSIFYVNNPELNYILDIAKKPKPYYSFKELLPGIKKNINIISKLETKSADKTNEFTPAQTQLLNLYHSVLAYFDLSRTFSLLLPQFDTAQLKAAIDFKANNNQKIISYYQLLPYNTIISNKVLNILNNKDISSLKFNDLSHNNQIILTIADQFKNIQTDKININLKIIPNDSYINLENNNWLAPWEVITTGNGTPNSANYLNLLQNLTYAYYSQDTSLWNDNSRNLNNLAVKLTIQSSKNTVATTTLPRQLVTEYYYNKLSPLTKTTIFYILSLLLSFFIAARYGYTTSDSYSKSFNRIKKIASIFFVTGLICHLIGIIMRIIILQRPPVANLYESILFVGLITALLSLMIEFYRKDNLGVILGSLICTVLQIIANSYAQTGDSLVILVAVLNNNFWLGTHVLAITSGYGCCLILSALSHIYLLKLSLNNKSDQLLKYILAFGLLSLFLTLLGTILGGIWADQSWGRFWGWDPKENGALLICLWLIAILHGRISNHLNNLIFVSLAAMTSITVALAWFGVNLLNTGLHSYGFTEHIATNLFLFIILELILIVGLAVICSKTNKKFIKN